MADLLGMPDQTVSLHGRLALAIGARGTGRARAHYESHREIINITKVAGGGSLAHEWAHALDNILSKVGNPSSTSARQFVSADRVEGVHPDVAAAFKSVMQVISSSGFRKQSAAMGAEYWVRPQELFARAFESWAEDALAVQNRKSEYLVSGTQKKYLTGRFASGEHKERGEHAQPYPHGEMRKAINAAMSELVAALRETGALKKALEALDARDVFLVLEKAGGPYVGPKGGLWADPKHTIHWDPKVHGAGAGQGDLFGEKKPEPKLVVEGPGMLPSAKVLREQEIGTTIETADAAAKKVGADLWEFTFKTRKTPSGIQTTKVGEAKQVQAMFAYEWDVANSPAPAGEPGGDFKGKTWDAHAAAQGLPRWEFLARFVFRTLRRDGKKLGVDYKLEHSKKGWTVTGRTTGAVVIKNETAERLVELATHALRLPGVSGELQRADQWRAESLALDEAKRKSAPALTVPADQPAAALPPRTLDTMSDAIALGSPSGKQSQASQQAAQARLGEALFGPGGLKAPQQAQPAKQEVLRRQAADLRKLAAQGVQPRKHLKAAERLEGMAEELEAVAGGPGTEKFDRAAIRAGREFQEWVGHSGSGAEKKGDELAKQLQQAPVQEWPKLAHQAQDAYEQALLHWDAAASWKADPNHASSRVLLGLFRTKDAKGRTPPKAESTDILWHMTPSEVEGLQGAAQTHMLRVRAKIDQVLSRLNSTPEVDQTEDHARAALESKHVAERLAIRDKYRGREVMREINGQTYTVPHPEEEQQLEALEPQQAAEHREALAPGSYLRKRGENARPAELAQLAEQSASHFRRAAGWLESQEKPSAARVRALAEKFEQLAAEHRGAGGAASSGFTLTGSTFKHKEVIKDLGGKWDPEKKIWTVPDAETKEILDYYIRVDSPATLEKLIHKNPKELLRRARESSAPAEPAKKSLALVVPADRLEKGAPRGGEYVKRAPRPGGGFRYYYSEKGYERATGHVDGGKAREQHLQGRLTGLLEKAGKQGLHPSRLADLVQRHGKKQVAAALKSAGCRFSKGRFYGGKAC